MSPIQSQNNFYIQNIINKTNYNNGYQQPVRKISTNGSSTDLNMHPDNSFALEESLMSTPSTSNKNSVTNLNQYSNSILKQISSTTNSARRTYSSNTSAKIINIANIEEILEEPEEDFEKFVEKIGADLIPFIKTQKGSRFMQKFLNKISSDSVDKILSKVSPNFKEIMTDNYGNYFMQKLTQSCTDNQRAFVIDSVKILINFLDFE
jgi:hypothetical protein